MSKPTFVIRRSRRGRKSAAGGIVDLDASCMFCGERENLSTDNNGSEMIACADCLKRLCAGEKMETLDGEFFQADAKEVTN